MVANLNILIIEQEPNMDQDIAMLNVRNHLLFMVRPHRNHGEIMVLAVLNSISGRQTEKLLSIQLIHAKELDIIDVMAQQIVDLIIKDTMEFVIKTGMEIMLIEMEIRCFMVQDQIFKLIRQNLLLL